MKIIILVILLFNFISMPVGAYEVPIGIISDDDFALKHSDHEIENIARQYAIDSNLFPAKQNRRFSVSYGVEGEVWLVFVSEPDGRSTASESLDYFYIYINDRDGRVSGIYYGLSGDAKWLK